MRLVDKQILRELAAPFLFGVAAFTSVFFAGSLLMKFTEWLSKGVPMLTALEIVFLLTPSIVVYTLPMAVLLGVLLGIGRLSEGKEIVALFAGGVSIYRIAIPVVGLGLVVSLISIMLSELVSPWASYRGEQLQAAVLNRVKVTDRPFSIRDSSTGNARVEVSGGMDPDKGILRGVTITHFANEKPVFIIYAERAQWMGIYDRKYQYRWRLFNGYMQTLGSGSTAFLKFEKSQTKEIDIRKTPKELMMFQKDPRQMSFSEMTRLVSHLKKYPDRAPEEIRQLDVDRWNKLALPLSSLVFAMIALPLAVQPQRNSSSVGMGLSVLLILLYWICWRYTTSLAVQGTIAPIAGAFFCGCFGSCFSCYTYEENVKISR